MLLEAAGFSLELHAPHADEAWPGGDPHQAALAVAKRKLDLSPKDELLTLAADTVVILGDLCLGKPENAPESRRMLGLLSGCEHLVITGFWLANVHKMYHETVVTRVQFRHISSEEIERYVETGEPFDKAGGYAIQGGAAAFIDRVEGSFTNIIGLPVAEVVGAYEKLQ